MGNLPLLQEKYMLTPSENESVYKGYILPMIKMSNNNQQ
jgi:hypothetical protein